jgi:hypothetical protein
MVSRAWIPTPTWCSSRELNFGRSLAPTTGQPSYAARTLARPPAAQVFPNSVHRVRIEAAIFFEIVRDHFPFGSVGHLPLHVGDLRSPMNAEIVVP